MSAERKDDIFPAAFKVDRQQNKMKNISWTLEGTLPYFMINILFHIIFITVSIRENVVPLSLLHHSRSSNVVSSWSMYSYNIFLYLCLFIINWLRVGLIYLLPLFSTMTSTSFSSSCFIEGFFFHVSSLFYVSIVLFIRLYWHYCSLSSGSYKKLNVRRLLSILLGTFLGLCLLTYPSVNQEWSSISYDPILNICLIDYRFRSSYTFFIIMISYIIPFVLMIISHQMQLQQSFFDDQYLEFSSIKRKLKWSSIAMLIWYWFNILLIISIHFPLEHVKLRQIIFNLQLLSFVIEPVFCLFMFRFMSKFILFQSFNRIYFIQ